MIMNTTIRKFTYFLTACLLGCLTGHAYEQDNWYLAWEIPVNAPYGVAFWEDSVNGVDQIYLCNGSSTGYSSKISVYDLNGTLSRNIQIADIRLEALDLCLDDNGSIFIAERNSVACLSNDGTFKWRTGKGASKTNVGSGGSGNGEFNYAFGIDLGLDNKLYVADRGNHRIQVLDKNGTYVRSFGGNGTAPGLFNEPMGITVLRNGNIVVSDADKLHLFDSNGTFLKRTAEIDPYYVSSSESGLIFAYDRNRGSIKSSIFTEEFEFIKSTGMYPVHNRARSCFTPVGDIITSIGGKLSLWKRAYRTKGLPQRNVIPQPAIRKISQRNGTNVLDLDFEIIDSDDTNATVGIFAYCDNQMILPKTWVDGTGNKIGTSIATNQTHRVSWDVKQDWNASTGNIKFEILCQDGRTNKPVDLHFLTLPFPDGNMTISRSPLVWADFVNYALFLLSKGEAQYDGNSTSEITYNGTQILHQSSNGGWVNGTNTRNTLLAALGSNYRFATTAEVTKAREAATPGTENAWDPTNQVVPRNLPYKVNEYGFDVVNKGSNTSNPYPGYWWVIKE